ncbi:hypothetical protein B0H14DRAFT_2919288 [Mycena olivaceomarginata]|nr:hypothetical protein B0H14DRAFT_2919288 [Mycena olivaceomarginata]
MSSTPSSLLQTTTTTTAPSASSATGAMDAREESTRGSTYGDDSASREKEATSTDSALGGEATRSAGYKGKALRSWMQLPPEVIRLIATYHLCVVDANSPVPFTWDVYTPQRYRKIPWTEHLAYLAARDTRDMETLMCVCPQWGLAVEQHEFWTNALQLLDPTRHAAHHGWVSLAASRPTPTSAPCSPTRVLPCRLNAPRTNAGLDLAKRVVPALRLGAAALCKEHAGARRLRYCGVCMIDGDIARRVREDALRMAQEDLARTNSALGQARYHMHSLGSTPPPTHPAFAVHANGKALLDAAQAAAEQAHTRVQRAMEAVGWPGHPNEDETVFPGVGATCRSCRAEWLWRYALLSARVVGEEEAAALGRGLVVGKGVAIPAAADVREGDDAQSEDSKAREAGLMLLKALGVTGASPGMFWPEDAAVKGAVNAFVELSEGTVNSVLAVAGERGWLRVQTRWVELMQQAMAAKRWGDGTAPPIPTGRVPGHDYSQRAPVPREQRDREREQMRRARSPSLEERDGRYANNAANNDAYARAGYTASSEYYDYDEDYEEEEDSEFDDDDYEDDVSGGGYRRDGDDEVAAALEMTVREMALTDWARARVLDGAWVAPADVYYRAKVNGLARQSRSHTPAAPTPPPPTFALAEAAHNAHVRQVRAVLLPALQNVVRRVVVECALDAAEVGAGATSASGEAEKGEGKTLVLDPGLRASRMPLAEIVQLLREEEGVWFDGMDWGARRRNVRREEEDERAARAREEHARERDVERDGERERERRHRAERSDDSSAGTPSDPSPVLSTSTLGTTPSPPPIGERDLHHSKNKERELDIRPTIPVAPVLDPPRLLRPIPYIPESITHLPSYSLEAIKAVWREACMPLYHCRCTVCERAMAAQNGGKAPSTTTTSAAARASTPAPTPQQKQMSVAAEREKSVAPDGHWVHVSSEDDADEEGADSVIKLVEEEEEYDPDRDPRLERSRAGGKPTGRLEGLEGLTDAELLWLQQEEAEEDQWAAKEKERGEEREMVRRWEAAHPDYEDQYEEEEEDDTGGGGGGFMLNPAPAAWVAAGTGRKRSVDELDGGGADAHSRGGTPPKRARTKEPFPELAKRRSEELDFDERDADSASVGSAPKRARIEAAESPLDSSTPVSVPASGEESASSSPDMRAK